MQNFLSFGPLGNPQRGQGRVLSLLKMKPEISQKELAFLLNMTKQSLAELLAKLEKNGYITRETSAEDRRGFTIKLTEQGAAAAGEMDDAPSGLEDFLDCLNEEELSNLRNYMKRIIERLEGQFTDDGAEMRRQTMGQFMDHLREHFGGRERPFGRGFHRGFFGNFHGCRDFRRGEDEEKGKR
jgi:DNA-binding MarR family transcriptional regulator